ncbi:MAG: hypothetical protein AB1830_07725 [Pseudomonadota bacterium]
MYFSGQGKLFVAAVSGGVPGPFRFVGNVPELTIQMETDVLEHKESSSGQRLTDLRLIREKTASFSATLEDFSEENLALALYGTNTQIAAGNVTGEAFPNPVANGDYVRLAKQKVSSVVIKDSAATPATLTPGTHYEVASADHGTIKILNIGTFVQPFKADYSYAQVQNINLFTQAQPQVWLRFEGLNTADANKPVLVELYKCAPNPLNELALIGEEIAQMQLEGSVLYDETKVSDTVLGQFGRVVLI